MEVISIKEFYKDVLGESCPILESFLEDQNNHDIGHFNVFNIADLSRTCTSKMPYNRRTYYKISLIKGRNKVEYADKTVDINAYGVLFATPKIPYKYTSLDQNQEGHFCIFTKDFLDKTKSGLVIDDLPIFKPNGNFVYNIEKQQYEEFEQIFIKIKKEIGSDYTYKYDLIRNYVIELIHSGQKLSPILSVENSLNASTRISTLFIELLERQFPIESPAQGIQLKTAADFASTLGVHVNHLNKVLKETTTKTTTEIISSRIAQEAKILLKQTPWNISEIAYSLGFDEVAHFSNFFKKNTQLSPMSYRK